MLKKLDHTAAVEHLSRVDRKLARVIAKSGPPDARRVRQPRYLSHPEDVGRG